MWKVTLDHQYSPHCLLRAMNVHRYKNKKGWILALLNNTTVDESLLPLKLLSKEKKDNSLDDPSFYIPYSPDQSNRAHAKALEADHRFD